MTETETREFRAVPRHLSDIPEDTDISNATTGAEALKLPLLPQGNLVAGVMEAKRADGKPLYSKVIVQIPRRSTKTTSIQNTLLGRCFNIPGHRVVSTAQTQAIARKVFLEMVHALELTYPDPETRPFKARIGNGQEELRWDNGSVWWIVAPRAGSFRSQAADDLWFDEAGEYSGDQTADLVEGAMPLMDTRPAGQVIISGTPPKVREGMLWDFLKPARAGKPRYGIVDFSMDPADDPTDEAVWWTVHAGLASGLTDIDVIRERFEAMPLLSFQREYLCADPLGSATRAIAEEDWLATMDEKLQRPDSNFALSFDVAIDGSAAAIAAAWYENDIPCVQVLKYRGADAWVAQELAKAMQAFPQAPWAMTQLV